MSWDIGKLAIGRINGFFFYKKMYDRFAEPKESDRNNEMTVLTG